MAIPRRLLKCGFHPCVPTHFRQVSRHLLCSSARPTRPAARQASWVDEPPDRRRRELPWCAKFRSRFTRIMNALARVPQRASQTRPWPCTGVPRASPAPFWARRAACVAIYRGGGQHNDSHRYPPPRTAARPVCQRFRGFFRAVSVFLRSGGCVGTMCAPWGPGGRPPGSGVTVIRVFAKSGICRKWNATANNR